MDSDLQPLPPLAPRNSAADTVPKPAWAPSLLDKVSHLMPLVMMAALALGSTWLVRQTYRGETVQPERELRHVPDYEMRGFAIERYAAGMQSASVIEGARVRHFPDTATLEIEEVRVRWTDEQGELTTMTAGHALMRDDRSEVLLRDNARLVRAASDAQSLPLEVTGEQMRFDTNRQRATSDLPVTVRQGRTVLEGSDLTYEHASGVLIMGGGVKGLVQGSDKRSR